MSHPVTPEPKRPHQPWRRLVLPTAVVLLAHLALLGLTELGSRERPSPLTDSAITRSTVIAAMLPPVSAPPAPTVPPTVRARPLPQPHPRRPTAAAKPAPPAESVTNSEAATDALVTPPAETAPQDGAADPATGAPDAPDAADAWPAASPSPADSDGNAVTLIGPPALALPGSVRLGFAATAQRGAQPLQGVFGELVWQQDGKQYALKLAWTFLFKTVRSQHSTGLIGATGIEPLRFSDSRKKESVADFDRERDLIVFGPERPSVPLLAGAQDRLSVVLQLGALLASEPDRYPPGALISIQSVGPRDAEIWRFRVDGEEALNVPAGAFSVHKLTRSARRPEDDTIELWLAPNLGFLPVRIKQTQSNGDYIDLQLRTKTALQAPNL